MRILGALVIVFVLLLTAGHALCQGLAETSACFKKIDVLLNQGDNRQAGQLLLELPEDGPNADEKFSRMARVQYEMGRLAASDQEALPFYQNAEKHARAAIAKNPQGGDGYKWLAIALGAQAKDNDTKTQIRLSREVKANIEKAIALSPDDDIAYLVLSRWHYKISALDFFSRAIANIIYDGLPDASLNDAESLLLQAIRLHDRIAHRYNLAKTYERMGRREEALVQLQKALLLPVTFPEEAEELQKTKDKLKAWQ